MIFVHLSHSSILPLAFFSFQFFYLSSHSSSICAYFSELFISKQILSSAHAIINSVTLAYTLGTLSRLSSHWTRMYLL